MYIGGDTAITSGYLDLDDIQNFHGSCAGRRTKFASGKEEARTGWSNVDKGAFKIGCKSYRINLIQSKTTHCAKLGLMGVQKI